VSLLTVTGVWHYLEVKLGIKDCLKRLVPILDTKNFDLLILKQGFKT